MFEEQEEIDEEDLSIQSDVEDRSENEEDEDEENDDQEEDGEYDDENEQELKEDEVLEEYEDDEENKEDDVEANEEEHDIDYVSENENMFTNSVASKPDLKDVYKNILKKRVVNCKITKLLIKRYKQEDREYIYPTNLCMEYMEKVLKLEGDGEQKVGSDIWNSFLFEDVRQKGLDELTELLAKPTLEKGDTCRRCKSTRTVRSFLQTRSSDEPMTVFSNCTSCGYKCRQ